MGENNEKELQMKETKNRCGNCIDLDTKSFIDAYDYHDAPGCIIFSCDLEKGHEGMHSHNVDGQKIFWE